MPADEKRKARIANSKAKSAFNKQLKAAGIDPKTVEIDDQGNVVMPQAAQALAAAPAPARRVGVVTVRTETLRTVPVAIPFIERGGEDALALGRRLAHGHLNHRGLTEAIAECAGFSRLFALPVALHARAGGAF